MGDIRNADIQVSYCWVAGWLVNCGAALGSIVCPAWMDGVASLQIVAVVVIIILIIINKITHNRSVRLERRQAVADRVTQSLEQQQQKQQRDCPNETEKPTSNMSHFLFPPGSALAPPVAFPASGAQPCPNGHWTAVAAAQGTVHHGPATRTDPSAGQETRGFNGLAHWQKCGSHSPSAGRGGDDLRGGGPGRETTRTFDRATPGMSARDDQAADTGGGDQWRK